MSGPNQIEKKYTPNPVEDVKYEHGTSHMPEGVDSEQIGEELILNATQCFDDGELNIAQANENFDSAESQRQVAFEALKNFLKNGDEVWKNFWLNLEAQQGNFSKNSRNDKESRVSQATSPQKSFEKTLEKQINDFFKLRQNGKNEKTKFDALFKRYIHVRHESLADSSTAISVIDDSSEIGYGNEDRPKFPLLMFLQEFGYKS